MCFFYFYYYYYSCCLEKVFLITTFTQVNSSVLYFVMFWLASYTLSLLCLFIENYGLQQKLSIKYCYLNGIFLNSNVISGVLNPNFVFDAKPGQCSYWMYRAWLSQLVDVWNPLQELDYWNKQPWGTHIVLKRICILNNFRTLNLFTFFALLYDKCFSS